MPADKPLKCALANTRVICRNLILFLPLFIFKSLNLIIAKMLQIVTKEVYKTLNDSNAFSNTCFDVMNHIINNSLCEILL